MTSALSRAEVNCVKGQIVPLHQESLASARTAF
jgi:hypothetical protein